MVLISPLQLHHGNEIKERGRESATEEQPMTIKEKKLLHACICIALSKYLYIDRSVLGVLLLWLNFIFIFCYWGERRCAPAVSCGRITTY